MAERLTAFEVYLRVASASARRSSLSVVRLGDGEGALLGYPSQTSFGDVNRFLRIWLRTDEVPRQALVEFINELKDAIRHADIVGLPRRAQTQASPLWAAVQKSVLADRLDTGWEATDTAAHRLLQHALLYRKLLQGRDFIGLITPRRVADRLGRLFSIDHVNWYGVRGEGGEPGDISIAHFPDGFERIRDRLQVPYPGALFLVGAGPFGVVYCNWIKQRGGVALDIGSIFDSWAGVGRIGRGAGIALRSLDVYDAIPQIRLDEAIRRYNATIKQIKIVGSPLADPTAEYAAQLPESW